MKKKIIIGSAIALILIAVIAVNIVRSSGTAAAFNSGKTFDVRVKKIEKGNISATVSASGVIEEVDKQEVYFETPLKVKKILVEKNQKVTKGQKLVELDTDSLVSQLEQEKINKSVQELAIKKAASGSADNNVKSNQIAYNNAKKDYENTKALVAAGAASQSELDKAKKALDDAEIALDSAKRGLGSQGIDVETQSHTLKATILKITDIETKLKKINDSAVSPIDGAIAEINIQDGGFTPSTQPAFKLVNPEKLRIKADIKEFDLKNVAVGQDVNITGDAINKNDGVTGKVESISPMAKKNKTTSGEETLVEVVVSIVKGHPVLKPGLTVTCDIITKVKNGVPVVTFDMLKEDKDKNKYVFVVDKNNIMHEKKVELGVTSDLDAEVISGVSEGEMVVLAVQPTYKDNSKVKIIQDEKK
ncbi:MAG: HlyD family efflux transporter periplasmic adaptor subunit [Clostridia bacterium]|nr:HlyD family efflux transporter periplasmic adaptor subunit [Clostridia bacterium]